MLTWYLVLIVLSSVLFSEMVTNELLATAHGQLALKAVQRFLSHNPEWVGQTIGAGLAPETEAGGPGVGAEHREISSILIGPAPTLLRSHWSKC